MTLKELLQQYDANILKIIAREHGIEPKNTPKNTLTDLLARKLAERDEVERALTRVGSAEREILGLVQRAGGEIATSVLENSLKKSKQIAPSAKEPAIWRLRQAGGDPNYKGKPKLKDAAAHLTLIGLAFAREVIQRSYGSKQVIGWELGRYLIIPPEIRALLPSFVEDKPAIKSEPARSVSGSARNFQRDLSRYWSFVRREGKLDMTTQGWVYKKTTTELGKALGWNDKSKLDEKNNSYFFFLRRMLGALSLMNTEQVSDWNAILPTTFAASDEKNFWALPPAERVKQSFAAYLDTTTWNELRIPKGTYGLDHRRPAPQQLKTARRVVIEKIKPRGASAWVALADVIDDLRLGNYEFLFPRSKNAPAYGYSSNYSTPYYNSNNSYGVTYNNITDEATGWDLVEGAIITHILTGPLHWLGLTDVGFDGDTPIAYRLTAMGAWLLGLGTEIQITEAGGRVVVQPNFQIVAMEPIADQVLMTLDEFTQFEGGDRALTYRLTRESVYRGQRTGWDAARMIAYLEEATHTPLPQNVKRSLEEWQALHERVTIRRGVTILQAEDAATLDELFANATVAPKLGRRVGADVALADEKAQAVNNTLRDADWLAVFTRHGQTDAPASVATDVEGNVTLVHRTPSIYAYEGIEPFAERIDARHARITPASVAAATKQNLSVPTMLARLRQVHRGEIPAKLITRLKAWGKYYGGAKLGALTLLEFRDDQARGELLDDPELKPHLERFEAGNRPLARVRAESLARVKELLAERGVDIREWNEK
ncbi:MAG: helicase-associated domain-containing protein [Chloroflexi bacterium]|nr:helicase-associated domain-containing protein [Chloroflexota bacterium]